MSGPRWEPIVYGRTRRVDRWWRALPDTVERDWVEPIVMAVTAGGRGLDERPRLVYARDGHIVLVGGACMARELSDTMNSDGRRALFCFVGWVTGEHLEGADTPALDELRQKFHAWAAPVYQEVMKRDWDLHESQVGTPHVLAAAAAPWMPSTPPVQIAEPLPSPSAEASWPEAAAHVPWDALRASSAASVLVTGWERAADARAVTDRWIGASDVMDDDRRVPPSPVREGPSEAHPTPTARAPENNQPSSNSVADDQGPWSLVAQRDAQLDPGTGQQPSARETDGRPGRRVSGVLGKVGRVVTDRLPSKKKVRDSFEDDRGAKRDREPVARYEDEDPSRRR